MAHSLSPVLHRTAYAALGVRTMVLTLWADASASVARLAQADLVLVGGGSTVNLLALCVGIVTGISLLSLPFFLVFEPAIVSALNAPGLAGHLWLVSPFVFVSGLLCGLRRLPA